MAHRGQDGAQVWAGKNCGLGHRVSRTNGDCTADLRVRRLYGGAIVVSAAGRLDNRAALLKRLDLPPGAEIPGDSELILSLYEHYGDDLAELLLGDFAFALYDSRRQRLLCARDQLGVQPLVYHDSGNMLLFASGVEAITAPLGLDIRLNRQRIADYLVPALERVDNTSTFYEKIYRLKPAHLLTVSGDKDVRTRRYWQLDPTKELSFSSDAECTEAFVEVLSEAVRARTAGQSGIALALSGGIDSGAIAALARDAGRCSVRTYSGTSNVGEDCAESRRLRGVLEQGGVEPTVLSPEELAPLLQNLQAVLHNTIDPFDNKMTLYASLCSLAARDGMRVMLDGVDDVVMDNVEAYTTYLLRGGHWLAAWRENSAMAERSGGELTLSGLFRSDFRRLFANRLYTRLRNPKTRRKDQADALEAQLISPALADEIKLGMRLQQYRATWPQQLCKSVRHANAIEVGHPFLTAAVERYDRIASRFGVESRHPYLDRRFVEFCLALPWQYKDYRGWPKITLRRAMEGRLPRASLWQRDRLHVGWKFNVQRVELMREEIVDVLEASQGLLSDFIDIGRLRLSLQSLLRGTCGEDDYGDLWTAFTLAIFLRRHSST